jgi:hypothetical protein
VLAENEVEITIGKEKPIVIVVTIPGDEIPREVCLPITFRGSRGIRDYVMRLTRFGANLNGASSNKVESWWRLKK